MKKLILIYEKLFSRFGTQGWWPVTKEGEIIPKYYQINNLTQRQKLEICFGAILTQNTNWKNVEKAIVNLNKHNLIDVNKILRINGKKLAGIIKSSGYNNQKAKKLKNFCEFLLDNYNGKLELLFNNDIHGLRKQLLSINGIGPETADSMILYAAKKPIFVIDAYTKRILNRIGYKEKTYDELQKLFMLNLPNNERLFNEYHALLVELGKNICKKEPLCDKCPINRYCYYYKNILLKHQELRS
jgi:endonuclease-3 related protein